MLTNKRDSQQGVNDDSRLEVQLSDALSTLRRAFAEFLTVPTTIIAVFLLAAVASYWLDRARPDWLEPLRQLLQSHVFADPKATSDLLTAVASGIISVTSLTATLLLIVVQQSASAMTAQVFDQFLRRRINQVYPGFFIGLALYSLITLATVNAPFNPIYSATLAFLLTVVALYLLLLLVYTTINQMRPVEIVEAIHDHTLSARNHELSIVSKTRREPALHSGREADIKSDRHGYVTRIDVDGLAAAINKTGKESELILLVSIGSYVAFEDPIARFVTEIEIDIKKIRHVVLRSIVLERQRDIDIDSAYGIEQLEMIGWTSISTAKSNPAPGQLTIRSLRDVLARWCVEEQPVPRATELPIVYFDTAFSRLLRAFETLAVVASESMQHQNAVEIIRTFTLMLHRLSAPQQRLAEDVIMRILSTLGDHVLTADLEQSMTELHDELNKLGHTETARAVLEARDKLKLSVGHLGSRATRAAETPT